MSSGRGIWGLIAGLGGAGLVGWSLFTLLSAAGCAGVPDQSCGAPGFPFGVPGGIVLAVIGMITGGGFLVFAALFMAIGGAALAIGFLGLMPDMPVFPWLFGGIFFASGLLPLFLGLAVRRSMAGRQALAAELMVSGARGIGTIVAVSDTGITLNDNPRINLHMRIAPLDGGPEVERSKTVTVSRVAIPRAGERFPVWYDRNDPDKWMFGTDMQPNAPAEVKDMFARARAGTGEDAAGDRGADSPVEELARLSGLWRDGALTDAEFAEAKARLLPRIGR